MSLFYLLARLCTIGIFAGALLSACSGGNQSAIPTQSNSSQSSILEPAARTPALHELTGWEPAAGSYGSLTAVAEIQRHSATSLPAYADCTIFPAGDYYNADITNAAVDPHSADYLSSVEAVDNTGFQDSLGIEPVNIADDNTPLYTVKPKVSWHRFPNKYPWQNGFQIENIGDAHFVAINKSSCHLYESYGTSFQNDVLSAYSGKDYDLRQPFKIGGGVMASGLSYFAGAVRHQEVATGIHHALNVAIWQNALCNCFTAPAAESDGVPYTGRASAYEMPYGAHLRLKASYNCSGWGPQSQAICNAMKHYGLYMSDTDGHYINNNKLFFVNPSDSGSWNGGDLGALNNLRFSDFDVLRMSKISN